MNNLQTFVAEQGMDALEPLPRDVSPREYYRGQKDGRPFIMMRYPNASLENKQELLQFVRIGEWLDHQGVKVSELYDLDEGNGCAYLEDLGSMSFGQRLRTYPEKQEELYKLAADTLKRLSNAPLPQDLPEYKASKIHENRRQLVEYYMSYYKREKQSDATLQSYLNVWDEIESTLPPCPMGFVHGDYHLENLMFAAEEAGIKQCALIDYQDAMVGPLPYDLVNLLEDARVDVPNDLRQSMISHYCADMSEQDRDAFLQWYRVLGTQFHCRVIGLFIKLAVEQGRDSYLIHINRLQAYIDNALKDPILSQLKIWFEKEGVDFHPLKSLHGDEIRKVFQNFAC